MAIESRKIHQHFPGANAENLHGSKPRAAALPRNRAPDSSIAWFVRRNVLRVVRYLPSAQCTSMRRGVLGQVSDNPQQQPTVASEALSVGNRCPAAVRWP